MVSTKEKTKLRRFIRELSSIRGRHTELVSVYIPVDYDLNKIIQHLIQEQSTASNIKDAKTRSNVIDSLERLVRHLRLFKKTPPNGLAIFAGNASESDNKVDIKVWTIEPPVPLKTRLYRCDQTFVLDLLKEMLETRESYGLIVMDRREATLGLLQGTLVKVLIKLTSHVPGKQRAGGQSAQRFHRIREGLAKEFYKKISDAANKEFLGKKELKGIIVGGPGPTKGEFIEYLNNEIKRKIMAVKDITYTDEFGLHHLVDASQDVLAKEIIAEEKKILNEFFETLKKAPNLAVYGYEKVKKALEYGAVSKLLISEIEEDKIADELEELAETSGVEIFIISTETPEGIQLKDLAKEVALLRFPIS